jgi:broad specificity phosphatase PhoE
MNEYLDRNRWDDAKFVDPMMFDTRLTERGEDQARQLVEITSKLNSIPELLVASPLHRAMRTADLAFSSASFDGVPRVTCVHARERVFHASDIGRSLDAIRQDFPGWCVEEIREKHPGQDEPWWYTGETNTGDELDVETQSVKLQLGGVPSEPSEVFERRMHDLLSWLNDRPEKTIAVIAHWGVWFSLTGREFENCELVVFNLDELKPGKGKMPV